MNGFNSRVLEVERLQSLGGSLFTQDQTKGFAEKRQFRAYHRFTANTVLKMVFAEPFYLTAQKLWTGAGAAVATISTGGVEGGTFGPITTKACKWLLDGPIAGNTVITGGAAATVTIVNEREVLESDSGTGGNANGNAGELASKRALPAGTYYFSIVVSGTTRGQYSLEWEEFA